MQVVLVLESARRGKLVLRQVDADWFQAARLRATWSPVSSAVIVGWLWRGVGVASGIRTRDLQGHNLAL